MKPAKLLGATLWGVLVGLSGCDPCPTEQVPTVCWTHEPTAGDAPACLPSQDAEPNDTLPTAKAARIGCRSETLRGTLGADDVDVFHAKGELCDDSAMSASWSGTGRLCLFAGCAHGLMTFKGCQVGSPMHFREGLLGCCLDGPGAVSFKARCAPLEKHIEAWVVVDHGPTDRCEDYTVALHD